jgi:tRNA pseudouridine55 synthase
MTGAGAAHQSVAGQPGDPRGRHDPGRPGDPTDRSFDVGGLLLVDKPAGPTSHDVVARIRGLLRLRRVGHAGTLDPMASGLLVVAVGRCTRLLGHLASADKSYAATIRLGVATVTDDAEGQELARVDASGLDRPQVEAAMTAMTGAIDQVPSAVSAIKVDGRRSYDLVRAGAPAALAARPVTVSRFEIVGPLRIGDGVIELDVLVDCSTGTYVRALARDLGATLGVGGHLTALRRLRSGPFLVDAAVDVYGGPVPARGERIPFPPGLAEEVASSVLPAAEAARLAFPIRIASAAEAVDLRFGRALAAGGLPGIYAVLDPAEEALLGLMRDEDDRARPVVVLSAAG